jgi:hypothetical protein
MRHLSLTALCLVLVSSLARAQAPCHAENDGPGFNDGVSISPVYLAIRFTAPASFAATRLETFTGETTATQTLGIWSHNAATNRPVAALGTGSMSVVSTNQWYSAPLATSVSLVAGQSYWIVWYSNGGGQCPVDVPQATLGQPYCASTNAGSSWGNVFQFSDRHWKFRIFGSCNTGPISYCTAGTTTNGCTASIAASASPSASFATPCVVTISGVEGQKTGILFYGLEALPQPWCSSGGASFLCVKSPTYRTLSQSSGGGTSQCNGALVLDWNAFQLANPGSLGAPFTPGRKVYLQGWFRDPPACKSTNLSNALELTCGP